MCEMKKGDKVKLKSDFDLKIWGVKSNLGTVLDIRAYGPKDAMITAQFPGRRVQISSSHLEVLDGQG